MTTETLAGLEKALAAGGDTHTIGDVVAAVLAGEAQLWEDEGALIVTEIQVYPRKRTLHFWLATGGMAPVIALSHRILAWGREQGIETATLAGRRGWERALAGDGWRPAMTVMERPTGAGEVGGDG